MFHFIRLTMTVLAALLWATLAQAASLDINRATQAELEGIKGIGPSTSSKILNQRSKGAFKDWDDLVDRIQGIGKGTATKLSAEGLTVNGASYQGSAAPLVKSASRSSIIKPTPAAPATASAPILGPQPKGFIRWSAPPTPPTPPKPPKQQAPQKGGAPLDRSPPQFGSGALRAYGNKP